MSPLALVWLRRIALGLPLVAAGPLVVTGCDSVGAGPSSCDGFDPMRRDRSFAIDEAQRASLDADGGVTFAACAELCGQLDAAEGAAAGSTVRECDVIDATDGSVIECALERICRGRPPAGLRAARPSAADEVARYLARAAHLERASVPAFVDLARELTLHDAPRSLIRGARRAAHDEARHARVMEALARRAGAAVPAVERAAVEPRSLREIALDNAVHGCVGEAHAAFAAAFQAQRASDLEVRRAHAEIARDEARHALLSVAVDAWARAGLRQRDRDAVIDARRDAARALARDAEAEASSAMRDLMGMPDAERAVSIARTL